MKERWRILSLVLNKSNKIFLCSNTKIEVSNKVDIILSPEFYWVRIFDIPVKNITQAKHVFPTLFEDILDNVSDLSYQAIKIEENKYLCFAYINKKIYEAIKNSGINLSYVNSVYFAQNECKSFKQFTVEDKSFLYTQDDVLVKVPNGILSENIDLNENLHHINLSNNKVDIKLYNNFLSSKQIYSIVAISLFISIINFAKVYDYKNSVLILDEKIELEKEKSNLPSSIIQVDSIISKYKNISDQEIKKREVLSYLLENSNFKLDNISLEKDILTIVYQNSDKTKVEEYINKKYKIISSQVENLDLYIRIKI